MSCKEEMLNNITHKNTLQEADKIINGERLDTYGAPESSFKIIADFWSVYLKYRNPGDLQAADVAILMTLFKIARMFGQKWHRDNAVDACGYLAILSDRIMRDEP